MWRSVKTLMKSKRGAKALRQKCEATAKDKDAIGHSAFSTLISKLKGRRLSRAGSSKLSRMNMYAEQMKKTMERREKLRTESKAADTQRKSDMQSLMDIMKMKLMRDMQKDCAPREAKSNEGGNNIDADITAISGMMEELESAEPPKCTKAQVKSVQNLMKTQHGASSLVLQYRRLLTKHGVTRWELIMEKLFDFAE